MVGAVMFLIGLLRFGPTGLPAFLAGFGGVPALLLTVNLAGQFSRATWSCSGISFTENSAYGTVTEVLCVTIPGQLIVLAAVFWCMALLGLAVVLMRRPGTARA